MLNNKNKIYYFGTYDINDSKYKRRYTLSATSKIDYILKTLNHLGYSVELISPSYIIENKLCMDWGGKRKIRENFILNLPPSFGYTTKIGKFVSVLFTLMISFIKLLKISKEDTLIVYHAMWYSKIIKWAKKLKGFQLVIEVEEIYTHAFKRNLMELPSEIDFIKSADKLILVNDLLANYLNYPKDRTIVSYGSYSVQSQINNNIFNDNKTHLVYAGSFSKRKSGAQSAVAAATFLPSNYILHVLGFGDPETTNELIEQINNTNLNSECKVIFEGEKRGAEYEQFMTSCDIGLCTQKLDNDYTEFAFPSKVLAYMGFGLEVVTPPLVSLCESSLNSYMHYYYSDNPRALADAILSIKPHGSDKSKTVIQNLHQNFLKQLNTLLNDKM